MAAVVCGLARFLPCVLYKNGIDKPFFTKTSHNCSVRDVRTILLKFQIGSTFGITLNWERSFATIAAVVVNLRPLRWQHAPSSDVPLREAAD